ncbi:hypothetical protein QWZ13_14370 [Reinekea marina]|uniref:hypothetical protein n=1 Tax=Reinekea marina TaxID=1310421 RepID=UPI0025B56733|nr:hypothetical protein [Reinekea marina]MDN3650101.1 hypothetical protein [Reinekea marina]
MALNYHVPACLIIYCFPSSFAFDAAFRLDALKFGCQLNEAGYSLYPSLGAMAIAYKLAG